MSCSLLNTRTCLYFSGKLQKKKTCYCLIPVLSMSSVTFQVTTNSYDKHSPDSLLSWSCNAANRLCLVRGNIRKDHIIRNVIYLFSPWFFLLLGNAKHFQAPSSNRCRFQAFSLDENQCSHLLRYPGNPLLDYCLLLLFYEDRLTVRSCMPCRMLSWQCTILLNITSVCYWQYCL